MGAASVTGVGQGEAGKLNVNALAVLANGPNILVAGVIDVDESEMSSPPLTSGTVVFPQPLPGPIVPRKYAVILTGLNARNLYVVSLNENDDGDFVGFTLNSETDGECMYIVVNVGVRPEISL